MFYIFYYQSKNEEKLAKQAEEEYTRASYTEANKTYDTLAKDYPDSKNIDKYKFFANLTAMQTVVRQVTNRKDYEAAVKRLLEFIEAHKDSPFAKPGSGYGHDIFDAGKKLGEDIAGYGDDRVKAFQSDRAKNGGELDRATTAVKDGRALVEQLKPFLGESGSLESLKDTFQKVENAVAYERARTKAIDRAKAALTDPTDSIIQSVEADLTTAGFLNDAEAQSLLAAAKGKLRDLVKYVDDPAPPQSPPPTAAASILFVTPLGETKRRDPAPGDPPSTVFLCVARGILYALDENSGALVWATRVGPDVTDPPAVARVELAAGLTDLAVVTSNVGNAPAVSGYMLKTGAARWYQPLPAPAAGPSGGGRQPRLRAGARCTRHRV